MSHIWDTPEFWARQEADEMLRDYPDYGPAQIAADFERTMQSYDGGIEHGARILVELRRRATAGVRFWTGPMVDELESASTAPREAKQAQLALADVNDIPW